MSNQISGRVLVFDDERMVQLMVEVRRHPKLMERIKTAIQKGEQATTLIFTIEEDETIPLIQDFSHLIGFLAAEVGVLLHGDYKPEELQELADIIRNKLVEKRTIYIN